MDDVSEASSPSGAFGCGRAADGANGGGMGADLALGLVVASFLLLWLWLLLLLLSDDWEFPPLVEPPLVCVVVKKDVNPSEDPEPCASSDSAR